MTVDPALSLETAIKWIIAARIASTGKITKNICHPGRFAQF